MPLRIDVPENFLNQFHKILENEPVENGNKLNLFSLKYRIMRFHMPIWEKNSAIF